MQRSKVGFDFLCRLIGLLNEHSNGRRSRRGGYSLPLIGAVDGQLIEIHCVAVDGATVSYPRGKDDLAESECGILVCFPLNIALIHNQVAIDPHLHYAVLLTNSANNRVHFDPGIDLHPLPLGD